MSSPSIPDRVRNQVDLKDRRCTWVGSDPLMVIYHDTEWGVPVHDDQKLFEFIVLDAMQAGLNFRIILQKRQNFKQALDGFDPVKIAKYGDRRLDRLDCPGLTGGSILWEDGGHVQAQRPSSTSIPARAESPGSPDGAGGD